jgi:hypothetical protein
VAQITFIHGISDQPEPATLLEQWRIAILNDDGIDLAALEVSLSMVYRADVPYPGPAAVGAAQDSNASELEQGIDQEGAWRHSIAKHLGQPALRTALQLALR